MIREHKWKTGFYTSRALAATVEGNQIIVNSNKYELTRVKPIFVFALKYFAGSILGIAYVISYLANFNVLDLYSMLDILGLAVSIGLWTLIRKPLAKQELITFDKVTLAIAGMGFMLISVGLMLWDATVGLLFFTHVALFALFAFMLEAIIASANRDYRAFYYFDNGENRIVSLDLNELENPKLTKKIIRTAQVTAVVLALISAVSLVFIAVREQKAANIEAVAKAERANQEYIRSLELQSEKNGSAYTIWHHNHLVAKDVGVRELDAKLKFDRGFEDTKEVIYPWDRRYPGHGAITTVEGVKYE
jgi:hypothetical protein